MTGQAPEVTLDHPSDGAVFFAPATITLTASAADADGTVALVEFYHDTTKLGDDASAPYGFNWADAPVGTYAVTAVAIDNHGFATVSNVVDLTVLPPGNGSFAFAENFDAMGAAGTSPPPGWSLKNAAGGSGSTWNSSIPAAGATSVATMADATGALTPATAPTSTNNSGYNAAGAGDTGNRILATCPTTNAGAAIQLQLLNTSGGPISQLELGYDIRRFTAVAGTNAEQLPGYWVFCSLDGGATWSNVAALNPTLSGPGGVIVPDAVGVTTVAPTTINLASPWAAGGLLLIRWVDDNANGFGDPVIGLDQVSITALADVELPPTVGITAPADATIFGAPASFTVTAAADGVDDAIAQVEFFRDALSLGVDPSAPYGVDVAGLGIGAYVFTAVATDTQGLVTTSDPITIAVVSDKDGDGLPDAWELAHGFDPDDPGDGARDRDRDDVSNRDEYVLGTDPGDSTSRTIVRTLGPTGDGGYVVTFDTLVDRLYTIQRSEDLVAWMALPDATDLPGTGDPRSHPDHPGAGSRWFYRIEVRLATP